MRLKGKVKKSRSDDAGVSALLKQYKAVFKTPENLEHYSECDYEIAERKFLIWCLENRPIFSKPDHKIIPVNVQRSSATWSSAHRMLEAVSRS